LHKSRRWSAFSVKDTGSGIEPEDIPHVFERFYRSEKSRSRKTGGMGLGLSIAKGLVEAHGGKMWVESCKDVGTELNYHSSSLIRCLMTRGHFVSHPETSGTSEKVPIKLNIKSKHKKPLKALN